MNIFAMLNIRSEFEEIVLNYKVPGDRKSGTLLNLKWFMENAHQSNSRKPGYKRAQEIARLITGACQKAR